VKADEEEGVLGAGIVAGTGECLGAVSAYEAHMVNVTAHVENALILGVPHPGGKLTFGTVFPEEFLMKDFLVRFSTSFCADPQLRVKHLDYEVWVEPKPMPGGGEYPCLADAMYIGIQDIVWTGPSKFDLTPVPIDLRPQSVGGDLVGVGTCNLPVMVTSGSLDKSDANPMTPEIEWVNHDDRVWVAIDVPVFEGYYNPETDALGCIDSDGDGVPDSAPVPDPNAKPSGLCAPTVVIPISDTARYDPNPDGVNDITLGAEIVIQVTNIYP
jgi:hypothetical protein